MRLNKLTLLAIILVLLFILTILAEQPTIKALFNTESSTSSDSQIFHDSSN